MPECGDGGGLIVGESGHGCFEVLSGCIKKRFHEFEEAAVKFEEAVAGIEAAVGGGLVVAAASGVELSGGFFACEFGNAGFDADMYILFVFVHVELAGSVLLGDFVKSKKNGGGVRAADDFLFVQHEAMYLVEPDVVRDEEFISSRFGEWVAPGAEINIHHRGLGLHASAPDLA